MSSSEKQPGNASEGLQIPGLVQTQESVEQLSFTLNPSTPAPMFVPVDQNGARGTTHEPATSWPISQAGLADTPLPPMPATRYTGGATSLPGLADMDTTSQSILQAGFMETPLPQTASQDYVNRMNSLAGLADFETAHQPIAQVSTEEALPFQMDFPPPASGFGAMSNPDGQAQLTRPISQAGLGSAVVPPGIVVHASTRALLLDSQPETLPAEEQARPEPGTTASRPPVVIRGDGRSAPRSIRPPQGRRHVISIAALLLLLVITTGTLFAVSPLGRDVAVHLGIQPQNGRVVQGRPNVMSLVAQATATAVVHQQNDGLDPTANGGGPVLSTSSGSLSWPYGYCTYWANLRYHELSGHWVAWHGNADQWVAGARLAGWNVSQTPHVPSIIVLMPGVQGASGVGHVAVVESVSGNVAHTSNMNWYTNGGGFGIVSYYDFTAGSGVYFIWA